MMKMHLSLLLCLYYSVNKAMIFGRERTYGRPRIYMRLMSTFDMDMTPVAQNNFESEGIHCVFIHGTGQTPAEEKVGIYTDPANLPSSLKSYWGDDINKWTKSTKNGRKPCTTFAFTYLNTIQNSWEEETLGPYISKALAPKGRKQRIFLHSMGNLIFFNAIKQNYITPEKEIDLKYTNIYSLAAPIKGTVLLLGIEKKCSQIHQYIQEKRDLGNELSTAELILEHSKFTVAEILAVDNNKTARTLFQYYCNIETGTLTNTYKSLLPFNDPEIIRIAQQYTKGAICGTNPEAKTKNLQKLAFGYVQRLLMGSETIQEVNDGDVVLNVCKNVASAGIEWSESPTSNFWMAPYEHMETTGGDDIKDVLNWLETRE